MLYLKRPAKIYLYLGVVDFRKQLNGLSQLVELQCPNASLHDSWFVFISRNKKQVKLLYWRGAGLCLWQYRLEGQRFELPSARVTQHNEVSWHKLKEFLSGYNIFVGVAHEQIERKRYS